MNDNDNAIPPGAEHMDDPADGARDLYFRDTDGVELHVRIHALGTVTAALVRRRTLLGIVALTPANVRGLLAFLGGAP